jgi:hypothetical protein
MTKDAGCRIQGTKCKTNDVIHHGSWIVFSSNLKSVNLALK